MPSLDSALDWIANAVTDAVDTRPTTQQPAPDMESMLDSEFVAKPYITDVVDEEGLRLASQYDYMVGSRTDLITAPEDLRLVVGDRVLVRNDENFGGFWSIWCYAPQDPAALPDLAGFIFEDVQTYKTTDFFTIVDWYAAGYSPASPPQAVYASPAARDFGEGPRPVNTFVKVLDDATSGDTAWAWYAYDGANWNLVARQNGTVQLTDAFFDAKRVVYGVATRDAGDIANRDGSWELREIFNALKRTVLSKDQMNDLFFSMLHFIHAQQDQVDWAFKTSFLSIIGYNEKLTQTPVQYVDTTQNLLDYIDEVKPYRVKVRDFKQVLNPAIDTVDTHATDFDKPVYFDPRSNKYRRLDPRSSADLLFMQANAPWKDWFENHQNAEYSNPASAQWNPIRRISVKISFDRTDPTSDPLESGFGWDLAPWDILGLDADEAILETSGSAGARVRAYYDPTYGMIENDVDELMDGMSFRGKEIDGGGFYKTEGNASDWDVTPYDTVPEGSAAVTASDSTVDGFTGRAVQVVMNDDSEFYGLRDPHNAAGHPEEFIPCQGNEFITMIVHTEWSPGAPPQFVTHQPVKRQRRATAVIPFNGAASSNAAVLVYMDGKRVNETTDYTIDFASNSITATLPRPRPDNVVVRAFGSGGLSTIQEQAMFPGDGVTTTFKLGKTPTGFVEITVDGTVLPPGQYTVSGRNITLAVAPTKGQRIMAVTYGDAADTATHVSRELVTGSGYALANRSDSLNPCEFATTIVDLDGRRLRPPPMSRQLVFSVGQFTDFKDVQNPSNVRVWVGDAVYTGNIAAADPYDTKPTQLPVGVFTVGRFLLFNDPALVGKVVTVAALEDYEFIINGGVVTLNTPTTASNRVEATTFQNGQLLGMETYVFQGESDGLYRLPLFPDAHQCIVSVNGHYLTPGVDYDVNAYAYPWDYGSWDHIEWDIDKATFKNRSALTIPGGQGDEDRIVVSVFRGRTTSQPATWAMISNKPTPAMMGDPKLTSAWDINPFSTSGYQQAIPLTVSTSIGTRALYLLNDSWQVFEWEHQDRDEQYVFAGRLTAPVTANATEIHVSVPGDDPEQFFTIPDTDTNTPGAVWINGERVEYFTMDRVDNAFTFGDLRRATRGSRLGTESRLRTLSKNGATTITLPGAQANVPPEVRIQRTDGSRTCLSIGTGFKVAYDASGLAVTLLVPRTAGDSVLVAQNALPAHPVGTLVRDVSRQAPRGAIPFHIAQDVSEDIDLRPNLSI